MSKYLLVVLFFLLALSPLRSQIAAGQWGICEFASLADLNGFDPSTTNWGCKLAFVQANNQHYYWNGTQWAQMMSYNVYTRDDSLRANRNVMLNGYALTFDGTTDVVIQADGTVGVGTTAPSARLEVANGSLKLADYGAGSQSGTSTYMLSVDAQGNVLEMNTAKSARVFYAPAIAIDVSSTATGQSLDLHQTYVNYFATPAVASPGAPASIPYYAENELYYYITDYDTSVLANVSLSATGVMTYDVISVPSDNCAIINVVFVVK